MSEKRSSNGDELAGVENVFEKNFKQFNQLLSHSDASEQLAKVRAGGFTGNQLSQSSNGASRHRQAQIDRVKKQIQKKKRLQQMSKGKHNVAAKPPSGKPIAPYGPKQRQQKQQMKNYKLNKPSRTRKSKKILQKAVTNFNQ